jgi:hypothetical protein
METLQFPIKEVLEIQMDKVRKDKETNHKVVNNKVNNKDFKDPKVEKDSYKADKVDKEVKEVCLETVPVQPQAKLLVPNNTDNLEITPKVEWVEWVVREECHQ